MRKIQPISAKKLCKIFEKAGFKCVRIEGDHFVYTKEGVLRPVIPLNVKYSQELANYDFLSEHSEYLLKEYENTKKDEAGWGFYSIVGAKKLIILYEVFNIAMAVDSTSNILKYIPSLKNILNQQLSIYSDIWSMSIKNHVRNEYSYVDFSTALAITKIKKNSKEWVFLIIWKLLKKS